MGFSKDCCTHVGWRPTPEVLEAWRQDSRQKDVLSTLSPHLHSRHEFWEKHWKARCTFTYNGDLQGKGRHLNGVGCFHLIITTADINEIQAMRIACMGTDKEWKAGQVLSKCNDEVGGGQTTRLRGEAMRLYFSFRVLLFSVVEASRLPWLFQNDVRRGVLFRHPGGHPGHKVALRTSASFAEVGSQLFTYASNAIKGLYKLSRSS